MKQVLVPTINNNDQSARIVSWNSKDGAQVHKGEILAVLETSKASYDLMSDHDGYLLQQAKVGIDCPFGSEIAAIFDTEQDLSEFSRKKLADTSLTTVRQTQQTITKAAKELIAKHLITDLELRTVESRVVRTEDIEMLLKRRAFSGAPAEEVETLNELSKLQKAVATSVTNSHREIPCSFIAVRVYLDNAFAAFEKYKRSSRVAVGIPELLVFVVGRQYQRFPEFFGQVVTPSTWATATTANVGVTMDMGKGLFVPVVHDAENKSLLEIATLLIGFRKKALRAEFKETELEGGGVTLSTNGERDTVLVVPIILPGQTSMLSVGAQFEEPFIAKSGELAMRKYLMLGISFDHRFINGARANAFLQGIKGVFESEINLE